MHQYNITLTNFMGCITGNLGHLNNGFFLQPLKYASFLSGKLGGILTNALQEARYLMNYIRKRLSTNILIYLVYF